MSSIPVQYFVVISLLRIDQQHKDLSWNTILQKKTVSKDNGCHHIQHRYHTVLIIFFKSYFFENI